ncbi:MAG: hypothetical protein K6U14_08225 [Firmicutes bacterium]|nr:hypothetical protein [Alicyclobacillaceae bacterium]MCL6497600.1 hypothetical protein [Bacillota bacterium]
MRPEDVVRGPERARRVRNESVWLYDMNADQLLAETGYVVIDSSLGVVATAPVPTGGADSAAPHRNRKPA